jgi:hypothetical protein
VCLPGEGIVCYVTRNVSMGYRKNITVLQLGGVHILWCAYFMVCVFYGMHIVMVCTLHILWCAYCYGAYVFRCGCPKVTKIPPLNLHFNRSNL